jgi:hypothetical protein
MSDLPVRTGQDGGVEMELALAGLAPSDYLLELNAAADGSSAQQVIAFRLR